MTIKLRCGATLAEMRAVLRIVADILDESGMVSQERLDAALREQSGPARPALGDNPVCCRSRGRGERSRDRGRAVTLRIGSLCSGIGGLELGIEQALEARTVWQVEIDAWCRDVLAKHWPDAVRHTDLRALDPAALAPIDLLCGGFPCQPASCAGHRKGTTDARWLWPDVARILRGTRPKWCIFENVRGLLTVSGGKAFDEVLRGLSSAGYDAGWLLVRASDVGAPHRRERVFILGRRRDAGAEPLAQWLRSVEIGGLADGRGAGLAERGEAHDDDGRDAPRHDAPRRSALASGDGARELADDHDVRRGDTAEPGDVRREGRGARGTARKQRDREGAADGGAPRPRGVADAAGEPEREPHDEGAREPRQGPRLRVATHRARAGRGDAGDAAQGAPNAANQRGLVRAVDGISGGVDGRTEATDEGENRRDTLEQGWPARPSEAQHPWEAPRVIRRRAPNWVQRVSALGNAVVPAVARRAALALVELDAELARADSNPVVEYAAPPR